jgi:hypothetical protein
MERQQAGGNNPDAGEDNNVLAQQLALLQKVCTGLVSTYIPSVLVIPTAERQFDESTAAMFSSVGSSGLFTIIAVVRQPVRRQPT